MPRYTPSNVSSKYGAPMGRATTLPIDPAAVVKLHLQRVELDSGGYDSGGAYWGAPNNLWVAYADESLTTDTDPTFLHVRADSRWFAKLEVGRKIPGARYYR